MRAISETSKEPVVESIDVWAMQASVLQFADARNVIDAREVLWLRVNFDDGSIGWGEGTIFGGSACVAGSVLVTDILPLILRHRAHLIHRHWDRIYQTTLMHGRRGLVMVALSALDVALWDALARRVGLPLVDLLGRYADRVMPYASAGFYGEGKDLQALREEVRRACASGFHAMKMKVGRQARLYADIWDKAYTTKVAEDVARVYAVRDELGPDRLLLIDANTEWDTAAAAAFLTAVEDADVFFLEEPVSPDHAHLAAELRRVTQVRIAGFETEYTRYAYRDILTQGAVDVVQPDACWCGGISEARRIAAMASAFGRLCVPHSLSSAVSLHANLQLVASLDNGFLVEWDQTGNPFVDDFVDPRRSLKDGWMTIPDEAGIGFTPQVDQFAQYVVQHWVVR
jgi:L-alanine-DL-glutamate epimerase-like enolase superfamily enzyme